MAPEPLTVEPDGADGGVLGRMLDPAVPGWLIGLGVGLVYAALATLINQMAGYGSADGGAASFWPAAGVTFAVLVHMPVRRWPWVLVAVFASEVAVDTYELGLPLSTSAGWGAANCLEPMVSALLCARLIGSHLDLARRAHLTGFMLLAVAAGPGVGAVVGAASALHPAADGFVSTAARWWIGDAVGVLVVAPLLLDSGGRRSGSRFGPRSVVFIGAAIVFAFGALPWDARIPLVYLLLPSLIWRAVRDGTTAAAEGVLVVAVVVDAATLLSVGPFAVRGAVDGLLVAQLFLATAAISGLLAASVAMELLDSQRASAQFRIAATHDPLTGLANRTLLCEQVEAASAASGDAVLLYIDLDRFKQVNDRLGHEGGDELLRAVAGRLRALVRPNDLLSRLAGDEFAVLARGVPSAADGERLAQRIIGSLSRPFVISGRRVVIGASIGITEADGRDSATVLRDADMAMYAAKASGRSRWTWFSPAMIESEMERDALETDLRRAIDACEFVLHYQPVVEVATGKTSGVEALVRWQHPTRGLLAPDVFIPTAEASGLIGPLGDWVLDEACRQLAEWGPASGLSQSMTMAVNLSAVQLADPRIAGRLLATLAAHGIEPARLCLELTETALPESPAMARDTVLALTSVGVSVAIDDFGTGYASLSYLQQLAVDSVKIDRSFVDGLGHRLEETTIVAAVIGLAKALGLAVVAEGVETAEQLVMLRDMGCDYVQGYYLRRPAPADELAPDLALTWAGAQDAPAGLEADALMTILPFAPYPLVANAADRYRVVLADDDPGDRILERHSLERTGRFEVVGEASDGEMAVRLAALYQPHLVLLDLKMPKVDGMSALPRLLLAAPGTKVVLLSGHATPGSVDRALAIGAAACFRKDVPDLAGMLVALFEPVSLPIPASSGAGREAITVNRIRGFAGD